MIYRQIQENESEPRSVQCDVLGVSSSRYYQWSGKPESEHRKRDKLLLAEIKKSYEDSDKTYGSPRVFDDLKEQGLVCSKKRVARLMRENRLVSVHKKKFRVTTNSKHSYPVAKNILNRDFEAKYINQKLVGDITYIPTREGWLYLAVVLDLYSRRVVGWAMADNLETDLSLDALRMAFKTRGYAPELFHSDRGVQYASGKYQAELQEKNVICSMSRKGNCWDNSVAESFFHTLKVERVNRKIYVSRAQARVDIFQFIEVFYNRKRKHSSLGYKSPVAFEM